MNRGFFAIVVGVLFGVFLGGAARAAEGDPIVGKWKFPIAVWIFKSDGTGKNGRGDRQATWKCLDVHGERKYEISQDGGKFVLTLFMKNGGAVMEGANNANHAHIVANRIHDQTPDNQSLYVMITPAPAPPRQPAPTPPPAVPKPPQAAPPSSAPPAPAGVVSANDPVVGKWKFPKGDFRVFNGDGTCSDDQGHPMEGASWKCVDPKGERKYAVTFNGGKFTHTMAIKEGGAILQWQDRPNESRVAFHIRGPATPHPVADNRVTPAPTPPIDTSRPAMKALYIDNYPHPDARPQAIHGDILVFVYREGSETFRKREVPLSKFRYKDLLAIEENSPALGQEPAFKEAKAGFLPVLHVGGKIGPTYTGVKVTSDVNDHLTLSTDAGVAGWLASQIDPADLPRLRATETAKVTAANAKELVLQAKQKEIAAANEAKVAEERRRKMIQAAATGNYLDDRAADVPNGGLPIEYVRFMQKIGDPWTRKPGKVGELPLHPPLGQWLQGLVALERGSNPALNGVMKQLQERVAGIYDADRQRKAYLAQQNANVGDLAARQQSGEFRQYDLRGRQVSDGSSIVDHAMFTNAVVQTGFYIAEFLTGGADDRASAERNESLVMLLWKFGEIYPPSPERKDLLGVKLNRSGIELTNTSGQALTNLTVEIELAHYFTNSRAREFRIVFVSKLENGKTLYMNADAVRNMWYKDWQKMEPRPEIASVWRGADEHWRWGVGGTVSVRMDAHALEGHGTTTVEFPDNARETAQVELKNITKALGDGNDKDRTWALDRTRQVLAGLPPNSPLAADAKAVLANPDAAAEKGRAMVREILTNGLVGVYTCTIKVETGFIFGPRSREIHERMEAVNRSNGPDRFVLEITGVTPERQLQASVYRLGHSEEKRAFVGPAPALEVLKNRSRLVPVKNDPPPEADKAPASSAATFIDIIVEGHIIQADVNAKVGKDDVRFLVQGARPDAK